MIKKNYIPTIDISMIFKHGLESKKSLKILKEIEKARGDTEIKSDVEVLREQMKKLLDRM